MTGPRAENTRGGRADLCGAFDWLPAETDDVGNSALVYRRLSFIKLCYVNVPTSGNICHPACKTKPYRMFSME